MSKHIYVIALLLGACVIRDPPATPMSSPVPPLDPAASEATSHLPSQNGVDSPTLETWSGGGENRARAHAHYQAGSAAYASGDFRTAAGEFLQAHAMAPSPINHYNVALCYDSLGEGELASRYYRAFLAEDPGTDRRAEVEASIKRLDELAIFRARASGARVADSPSPAAPPSAIGVSASQPSAPPPVKPQAPPTFFEWRDFDVCFGDPLRYEYVVRDGPQGLVLETTRHKLCTKDPTGEGDGCDEGAPPGLTLWENQEWKTTQLVEDSTLRVLPLDEVHCSADEREYAQRGARGVATRQQWMVGITFPKPREQCNTVTAFSPDTSVAPRTAVTCVQAEGIGVTFSSEADVRALEAVFAARRAPQRGVIYSSGQLVIRYSVDVSPGDSEFGDIDFEYENRSAEPAAIQFTVAGTGGTGTRLWARQLGTGRLNPAKISIATVRADLDTFPLTMSVSDVKLCPIDPALAEARNAGADDSTYVSVCATVRPEKGNSVRLRRPDEPSGQ
jgi:hypothetical protein